MTYLQKTGIHHVGYIVEDLPRALNAIAAMSGNPQIQRYDFKPQKAWFREQFVSGLYLKIAMLSFEGRETGIEVIQPVSAEGYHMDFLKTVSGGGINHICYEVDREEYEEKRKQCRKEGLEFVFESETEDRKIGYRRCFYVKDMAGSIIELKEKPYFRK